ncbi:MAG: phosphatidylglycerophosphatase A [Betaproteobacteria bacterium RIFCSPLOWO2_02_FULL_62_79]|nr:MAG: phosphatidylglycerophosphatase A [Betaproteobacteria bacterium RIFCSPLOWO2_02_FULL_62_79]
MAETSPSWRFVLRHPAHLLAFGFGAGLVPGAPGTAGTLLALPLFWLAQPRLAAVEFLLLLAIMFVAGVWACEKTGRALGMPDHGGMVWDEIVAFLLVLFFTPDSMYWQAFAFLLFRLFDILKPPPIRYFDQTLKGGFGVMFDDIIAAFYTLLVLAVAKALLE